VSNKILALVSAGAPGLTRLLFFVFFEYVFGLDALGEFSSSFFIAMMICFFTSIGWSLLVEVRVPASAIENRSKIFSGIFLMSIMATAIILFVLMFLGRFVSDFMYDVAIVVVVWGGYTFLRSWFFVHRQYKELLLYDVFFMCLALLSILISFVSGIYFSFVLLAVVVPVYFVFMSLSKVRLSIAGCDSPYKGVEFGLVNFLSSSILLSFVPLVAYFESSDLAGYVTLLGAVANIGILIPRAVSAYQMPMLASMGLNDKKFYKVIKRIFAFQIISNFIFFFSAFLVISHFVDLLYPVEFTAYTKEMILFLMVSYTYVSICSIVPSNVLCIAEDSRYMIYLNATSAAVFYFMCISMFYVGFDLYVLYVFSICIGFFRLFSLSRHSRSLIIRSMG